MIEKLVYVSLAVLALSAVTMFGALYWGIWSDFNDLSGRVFGTAAVTAFVSLISSLALSEFHNETS